MRDLSTQMKAKEFVKAYFRGVESGQDVTQRLQKDDVTLSAPDLIANLVGWLEEAEPSEGSAADAAAQSEQALAAARLPSQEKEEQENKDEVEKEESKEGGGSSSDGTSRPASSEPSKPKPAPFG